MSADTASDRGGWVSEKPCHDDNDAFEALVAGAATTPAGLLEKLAYFDELASEFGQRGARAQVRASMRNGPASVGILDGGNETLRAPAFGALIDVMHEARLLRLGAGKTHFRAALYANGGDVEPLWIAFRHHWITSAWMIS